MPKCEHEMGLGMRRCMAPVAEGKVLCWQHDPARKAAKEAAKAEISRKVSAYDRLVEWLNAHGGEAVLVHTLKTFLEGK